MLHLVERLRQPPHFILPGHGQVGGVVAALRHLSRGLDHPLDGVQHPGHFQRHQAAQSQAEHAHHGLQPLDPVAEGRDGGVLLLPIGDGGVEQLLGVLAQIAAAGGDLVVIELGRLRLAARLQGRFQLADQRVVVLVGGADGPVEQILLLTDRVQIAVDPPQPGVHHRKGVLQLGEQSLAVAVLPAVILHGGKAPLHPVLEAADGIEIAHLLVQLAQHGVGLVKAEDDLCRQGRKKGRKAQADALLQVQLAVHGFSPFPPPFCSFVTIILPQLRPIVQVPA